MELEAKSPIVTIIMPVHNGEKHLRNAIESILGQTFSDFTFLIIDDGSTDESVNIAKSYTDPRIKLKVNEENFGISKTLNIGIECSKSIYIARMDQDDISLPSRIETQVHFMNTHPEVGVCGTWIKTFGAGRAEYTKKLPAHHDDIKVMLLFQNPMAHPTVMMRRDIFNKNNLRYDTMYDGLEDYDLWEKTSLVTRMENIPIALLRYRLHPTQLSRTSATRQEKLMRIQERQYQRLGINTGDISSLLSANGVMHLYNSYSLRRSVYWVYYKNLKCYIKGLITK